MKGTSLYPSEDAVNRLLVHVDCDGVFSQARGDGAKVVQRRHPERHFCLFVTELVYLKQGGVEDGALTAGGTGRHLMCTILLTSSLPSKLSSSSAAGHSGLLTVDSRSWTKFSNRGL